MDEIGSADAPYRVGLLPVGGFALMSYSCVVEPLRAANLLARHTLYEISHFGPGARVQSSGGATVETPLGLDRPAEVDLILVIAGGDPFAFNDPDTLAWLRRQAGAGVAIGGVSGGPVLMAKAGLLAGRRIAVHWEHAALLAERYPEVVIERRLFVIDRDRVTCGGGIAPLDLMHGVIAGQHGSVFAQLVSDWFLHTEVRAAAAPQRGGVAKRIGAQSPHLQEAVSAMESHVGDPLNLSQLALIAGVTPRHLNRLFREHLEQSAMEYYRDLRLEVGRRLVRGSALAMTEIASSTGFATPGHFSTAYKNRYGVRPKADRSAPLNMMI